jgi:hypothetical protein
MEICLQLLTGNSSLMSDEYLRSIPRAKDGGSENDPLSILPDLSVSAARSRWLAKVGGVGNIELLLSVEIGSLHNGFRKAFLKRLEGRNAEMSVDERAIMSVQYDALPLDSTEWSDCLDLAFSTCSILGLPDTCVLRADITERDADRF